MDESATNTDVKESIKEKLETIPTSPGIYQFKNLSDKIIYIGKAKNLRNRVRSYFRSGRPVDAKTKAMVQKIDTIDYIVVDSEAEALILEDTLIKKYKPRYNILLRDDKTYPYIRVTNEQYPRIFVTRTVVRDGSKYFGPFTDIRPMKHLLRILRSIFFFRSCDLKLTEQSISEGKFKICLDFHIRKCEGPCENHVSREEYNNKVKQAFQILNGKSADLEKALAEEMRVQSEKMQFEEAAETRNRLLMLKEYTSHQKIVDTARVDRDIFAISRKDQDACTLIFKIREGKLVGKRHFIITNADDDTDERIIQRTIEKWYLESEFVPSEILLPAEPDQIEYLMEWLQKRTDKSIHIHIPKIGDKKKLMNMAAANAEYLLRDFHLAIQKREQTISRPVQSLQRDLRLKNPPLRIECFDNSHIQGSELVSSMVVFENGKPKKADYRKFIIKTVHKNDDFAAMREVVERRYVRLLNEKADLPDLIIIDGGKGQLSAAWEILYKLGIENKITIVGLAKRLEEVFFPHIPESVILPKTSSSLRLIQQIRDEAHRFAITFHRELRSKRTIKTDLTNISGIGEKTAQKLLVEFGSVKKIIETDENELLKVVNISQAKSIKLYFEDKTNRE